MTRAYFTAPRIYLYLNSPAVDLRFQWAICQLLVTGCLIAHILALLHGFKWDKSLAAVLHFQENVDGYLAQRKVPQIRR